MTETREVFTISRQLEYLTENELTKQMGYSQEQWPLVLVKELLDNSLDNAEEIGTAPEVAVTIDGDVITVADNGSGIDPTTVDGMLDPDNRVSSREAWRTVTRGLQGNASKCLLGLPYAWNPANPGHVTIRARGLSHTIAVGLDQLVQKPKIEYSRTEEKVQIGTSVEVRLSDLPSKLDDREKRRFVLFGERYAALNPHLALTLTIDGNAYTWTPTTTTCPKWTAAQPDPPAWYDLPAFERLTGAMIAKDRAANTDRPLRDFVRRFAGLKRSDALKAVADETGLTRCNLSALLNCNGLDRTKTETLLAALQRHGKNPDPKKLGAIGREHIDKVFGQLGAYEGERKYRRFVGTQDNLPFVVEAAFTELAEASAPVIITGCNFSPAITRSVIRGLDAMLVQQMIKDDSSVAVLLHITMPNPPFPEKAKAVLSVPEDSELDRAISRAVVAVTADYAKQRKAEERDARAAERREHQRNRRRPETQLKDAINEVLPEAISKASGGGVVDFSQRDLYYAARQLIQAHTDRPLTQSYFNHVLDYYEVEHGLVERLTRDPRGYLLEPHTGRKIPLGTKAVDDYQIPLYLYNAIAYFEKKGMETKCAHGQIAERFDCAIMASEGYAVRAAKQLLQAAQRGHKMKVLCFHDADPAGYNIDRTLSRSSGAHKFNIEIIDAGLTLAEALEMGLPVEMFDRKKALPSNLELTDLEREYFTGDPRTVWGKSGQKTHWINCRRVELNALSADPHKFISWVESKLRQHGVAEKLVPPKKVIHTTARGKRDELLEAALRQEVDRQLDVDDRVAEMVKQLAKKVDVKSLPDALKKWAAELRPESWRRHLEILVRERVDGLADEIEDLVAETF